MPEAATVLADHDQLIKEVFIDPIRTVIAVDDEYPTLDSLTEKEIDSTKGWSGGTDDLRRVQELLRFARSKPNPWLVDVHDGKGVTSDTENKLAPHLQHSDLLVLDYHLDGHTDHGELAIDTLRALAASDHFNLVIVYTKGYQGDFRKVAREIALGLTYADTGLALLPDVEKVLLEALSEWEDQDEDITQKLKSEISNDTYLTMRGKFSGNHCGLLGTEEGKKIVGYWKDFCPNKQKLKPDNLAKWLLHEKQKTLMDKLSPDNYGNVQAEYSESTNWIRTDKLFVTVLPKDTCLPSEFESKLLAAIKASNPSPHRLLLTKMRTEIDRQGLTAETAILGNQHVQAVWLNDFMSQTPADHKTVIVNTVDRHWEALGDQLRTTFEGFADRLHSAFSPIAESAFDSCGLKKSDATSVEALTRYNCYSSTKPIDRSHLTTGHIIQINSTEDASNYWICLSPACDMVPGQKVHHRLKDTLPFIAVKLHPVLPDSALRSANKNVFLFLELSGTLATFSIFENGSLSASPDWEQVYAWNAGKLDTENKLCFSRIIEEEGELQGKRFEATVVAQLRSQYALNLLQRIGTFLSRPGLGINFKKRNTA